MGRRQGKETRHTSCQTMSTGYKIIQKAFCCSCSILLIGLMVWVQDRESGDLCSTPGSATNLLCALGQITQPLCASLSLPPWSALSVFKLQDFLGRDCLYSAQDSGALNSMGFSRCSCDTNNNGWTVLSQDRPDTGTLHKGCTYGVSLSGRCVNLKQTTEPGLDHLGCSSEIYLT